MAKVKHVASPEAARLVALVKGLDGASCKVGWFPGAAYGDGTPAAYVAAIHEFGYAAGGIPPRPTIRPTIEAQQQEWKTIIAGGARQVIKGSLNPIQVFNLVGSAAVGDIQKAIAALVAPPLKKATLAARRNRPSPNNNPKPLVDTRYMYNTLTYVSEGGKS